MPAATSFTSAPTTSHISASSFMKEIFAARKALLAYLMISAVRRSVMTMGARKGRCSWATLLAASRSSEPITLRCGPMKSLIAEPSRRNSGQETTENSIGLGWAFLTISATQSPVPIGTGDWVADIVRKAQPKPIEFSVVSCPEFLREGSAISDFMGPHRNVIGSLDRDAANKVAQLHLPLRAPIVITDLRTAEIIKYASNAFLAAKISFMNELADMCEVVGADVKEVAAGMGYDARIGRQFLDAGLGWGGSCFPKDVQALAYMAKERGLEPRILNEVMNINYGRRKEVTEHVKQMLGGDLTGKTVGLFGLAFKPNTDDMRDAPSIDIAADLVAAGAKVCAYDPVAMEVARPLLH